MTAADLTAALRQLGDTADAVALTLARGGCVGVPSCPDGCPVAAYLRGRFPGHTFDVTGLRVEIDRAGRVVTPLAVMDFVNRFDCDEYPHLIARTA